MRYSLSNDIHRKMPQSSFVNDLPNKVTNVRIRILNKKKEIEIKHNGRMGKRV